MLQFYLFLCEVIISFWNINLKQMLNYLYLNIIQTLGFYSETTAFMYKYILMLENVAIMRLITLFFRKYDYLSFMLYVKHILKSYKTG